MHHTEAETACAMERAAERTPRPKSPPEYAGLYGNRRHLTNLMLLEKEITSLQEELKSLDVIQPSSRCCQEVNEFVVSRPDPLLATGITAAAGAASMKTRRTRVARRNRRHSRNHAATLIGNTVLVIVVASANWILSTGTGSAAACRLFHAPSQAAVALAVVLVVVVLVAAASNCVPFGAFGDTPSNCKQEEHYLFLFVKSKWLQRDDQVQMRQNKNKYNTDDHVITSSAYYRRVSVGL
ncbi:hypothetical protein V2J09_000891 [Rumex salicifolius]